MSKDKKSSSTQSLHQKLSKEGLEDTEVSDLFDEELDNEEIGLEHPSYQELQDKLTEAEQKVTEYWEKLLRMKADSENAERRKERDVANAHKFALEKFVAELLPVVDNFERAIEAHSGDATDSMLDGVVLTLKTLTDAMSKFGVNAVNPVGEQFDPSLHEAVSMQDDPDAKSGAVLKVLQKGYLLNNRPIRPALVIVAK